jgi:hypothetical protein
MDLVERFKRCGVKDGRFRRGPSYPSSKEREEIARVLSEHLDEVGAEIGPNFVKAMAEAFGLDERYLYSDSGQSLWFVHSSNRYLKELYGIKTKKIGRVLRDHINSYHFNWWADELRLNCSIAGGGRGSVIYYKNEKRLEQYLSETLRKPKTIFEFTWDGSKVREEGGSE